jgi:hypothetical protein
LKPPARLHLFCQQSGHLLGLCLQQLFKYIAIFVMAASLRSAFSDLGAARLSSID